MFRGCHNVCYVLPMMPAGPAGVRLQGVSPEGDRTWPARRCYHRDGSSGRSGIPSTNRPSERGPQGVVASALREMGRVAADDNGPEKRRAAERDPRLLRGRAEPHLDGDEWLGAGEPAWWLNLQADPQALVELAGGTQCEVLARPAVGEERERLWQRWRELDKNLDSYAARRPHETAVVVLEPRADPPRAGSKAA